MSSLATRAGTAADKASENLYVQASLRKPEAPASIDLPRRRPVGVDPAPDRVTQRETPMSQTMEHRSYSARIEHDDEDGLFVGCVAGIRDGVGFHADTVEGLRAAFREAVDDYLATCARLGRTPRRAALDEMTAIDCDLGLQ